MNTEKHWHHLAHSLVEENVVEALVWQCEEGRSERAQQRVVEEGEHRGRVDVGIATHLHRKETLRKQNEQTEDITIMARRRR